MVLKAQEIGVALGKILLLISIFTSALWASDLTILVDNFNKPFVLKTQSSGEVEWVEAPTSALHDKAFDPKPGFARTLKGTTQLFQNERHSSLVRLEGGPEKETPVPLPTTGGAKVYQRVLRDAAGHLYGELVGGGYTFMHIAEHFSISQDEFEYATEAPTGTLVVPNPKGAGIFFLDPNGENVIVARPPSKWGEEFKTRHLRTSHFAQGRIKRLLLVAVDGKPELAAVTASGTFGLLKFEDGDLKTGTFQFQPVAWPNRGTPVADPDIRTSFEALPKTSSSMAITLAGSPDPVVRTIGTDRIVWRDGKLTRIGRHGETVPAPQPILKKLTGAGSGSGDGYGKFVSGVRRTHTDEIATRDHFGEAAEFIGRKEEIERVMEILVRSIGNHPIITGDVGAGRSTIGALLAQALYSAEFVDGTRFATYFRDAVVVETTPESISSNGGVAKFFASQLASQHRLDRPVVTVLSRMEQMAQTEFEKLQDLLQSEPDLLVVGVATSKYVATLKRQSPEFPKAFEVIQMLGMSDEETRRILTTIVAPKLAQLHRSPAGPAVITDEAIEAAIKRAKQIYPDLAFPEAPRRLLEDMVISTARKAGAGQVLVDGKAARAFVKKTLALPFDPDNQEEFEAYIADLRKRLNDKIVDQERVVGWLVDSYRDIVQPNAKRRHRTVLLLGPTGGGKTYSLQTAFKEFFGSEQRILEIDCTKYLEKEALTTLLGSWPGYVGSDKLGVLPQFLSQNGKNFNGIIFNEWEKASKELANAVMEMMDTGVLTDSHGNRFHLGTSMIGLTSNKGDKVFFPRNSKLTREEQEKRAREATSEAVKQRFLEPEPDQVYDTKNNHTPANVQRIDAAFYMLPPSNEGTKRMLREMTAPELETELGVRFIVDEALLDSVLQHKYVPENGVREPQRAFKDLLRSAYHAVRGDLPESGVKTVTVRLVPSESEPAISVAVPGKEASAQTLAVNFIPKTQIPLEDPATREKIRTLRTRLSGKVFGQDPAIETLAKSIINQRYVDPDPIKPGVAGFFGPTGTGKSALAEVVGEVEFGSPDRTRSFQMGNIKTMDDVDNLFGTARGRSGSESPAEFEQFIQQYADEGGVLHFEEIGNVGADNPRVRDAVFRILYSILEGKWTNAQGKTYKTSKFFVVFSSNEGQELFASAPADDLRMAIYKRSKSQEFMRTLLREHKWPEPLIGRMQGHLILFKPLLAEDRLQIARKFFDGVLGRLKKRYPLNVEADDVFLAAAAETFFSHEQGARAVLDFFEQEMRSLFGTALTDLYEKHGEQATSLMKNARFKLELRDNYAGLNFFVGPRPDPRKVEVVLKLVDAAGVSHLDLATDITELAPERHLPSRRSLLQTAYHEAGHVVGNDPELTGQETDHVTIIGKGRYGGYARPISVPGQGSTTRQRSVAYLGMLFSGRVTESYAGYEPDAGWSQDLKMAREAATRAVAQYGLTDHALRLPMKDDKVDLESEIVRAEIEKLMNDGFKFAAERIKARWPEIRLLAYRLFKKQAMDLADIKSTIAEARSEKYLEGLNRKNQKEPRQQCIAMLELMEQK